MSTPASRAIRSASPAFRSSRLAGTFPARRPISNRHIQDLDVRVRLPSLFPQNFQYPGNGLADAVREFIHGLPLRIAARKGWNLRPESTFRVFVDKWPIDVSIPQLGCQMSEKSSFHRLTSGSVAHPPRHLTRHD